MLWPTWCRTLGSSLQNTGHTTKHDFKLKDFKSFICTSQTWWKRKGYSNIVSITIFLFYCCSHIMIVLQPSPAPQQQKLLPEASHQFHFSNSPAQNLKYWRSDITHFGNPRRGRNGANQVRIYLKWMARRNSTKLYQMTYSFLFLLTLWRVHSAKALCLCRLRAPNAAICSDILSAEATFV